MIELHEDDIFQYLLTSDFHETYSPDEYRFLMNKWRYYYRSLYGQYTRMRDDLEGNMKAIELEKESCKKLVSEAELKVQEIEEKYQSLIDKELTWKERWNGKITKPNNES